MKMRVAVEVFDDSGRSAFSHEDEFDVTKRATGLIEAIGGSDSSAPFIGRSVLTEAARIAGGMIRPGADAGSAGGSPGRSQGSGAEGPSTRDSLISSILPEMGAIQADERRQGIGSSAPPMRAPVRQDAPPPEMNSDGDE